jgi:4-amino-4-deoxy-L-arabinose transferase-like glycosyltransferase
VNESIEAGKPPVLALRPREVPAMVLSWASTRRATLLCGVLLSAMGLCMLATITRKGITADENVHIPAGYYHLVQGDFQYLNPHPPLPFMLSAVPLLFIQPNESADPVLRQVPRDDFYLFLGSDRFWAANDTFFSSISFWTRVPMIGVTVLLGLVIFRFARKLFGDIAAVLSVALFSLEPTVLAHGRVVHTDVPSALALLLFCFAIYAYTNGPILRRAIWLGVATGLAPLTKFSMVALAPVIALGATALLSFAPRLRLTRKQAALHVAAIICASILVINAAYFFDNRPLTDTDRQWIAERFPAHPTLVLNSVRGLRHIVPTDFLMGIFWQIAHANEGHPASLLGNHGRFGWWYYFPVAFALKTTLPFLFISVAAVLWTAWRILRKSDASHRYLLLPFMLFTAFLMTSTINIGVRYYLPAYPFLFIMSGALLANLWRIRKMAGIIAVSLVLGWSFIEVTRTYPNYMPYMNQLAFSRPHWWYLSDSNVEWGDDVAELAAYLRAHGETRTRAALLGGQMLLKYYGVEYVDTSVAPSTAVPETTYIAIGASYLNGSTVVTGPPGSGRESDEQRVNFFDEYRRRTPEVIIGDSIYVFRVR